MKISEIISVLEEVAPPVLQESYDNSGLLIGSSSQECTGVLLALDSTLEVIDEAIEKNCNLVVAHHPLIFKGLKRLSGNSYVERTVIKAIRHDIAVYAIHTNLDNVIEGVSGKMASLFGLKNTRVLAPREGVLKKLYSFVPASHLDAVRDALFAAGAGHIGNYDECSFQHPGNGTFRAGDGADPFTGSVGLRHNEPEHKLEVIYYSHREAAVVAALKSAHPYEEVAYDLVQLQNKHQGLGSGIIGTLEQDLEEGEFLRELQKVFGTSSIRHSPFTGKKISKVAFCGGAGSFLISRCLGEGADAFVTADLKYHEFFDADGRMLLADIGHYESEQFTISLLAEILVKKFPTFAVLKTGVNTNPVRYYKA